MQVMLDWDLLRYFVALHRAGSMTAAARALGVDQTTVGRRIAALEERVGAQLFRRTLSGHVPTAAADEILETALRAEAAIEDVERRLAGHDTRLEGVVRVTITDTMTTVVLQSIAGFRASHPRVQIDLLVTNQRMDLSRGEADLAIRMARPREPRVVARRAGELAVALYASATYLKRRRVVRPGQLEGHDLLSWASSIPIARDPWVAETTAGATVAMRANSALALTQAAVADLGIAVLPCLIGDAEPRLIRIGAPHPSSDIWLAMHHDLRDNARVRAVFDYLATALTNLSPAQAPLPGRRRERSPAPLDSRR
jgi:DNA-binding transcriptional LysR family regulator